VRWRTPPNSIDEIKAVIRVFSFIGLSPVDGRINPAQWRRAIARSHKESEIPAYSPRWALARTG